MKTDTSEFSRFNYDNRTAPDGDLDFQQIVSEAEDYESGPPLYEISTYPADFTLEVLHDKWRSGDIKIPKFQRQFVWKQIQASKLIESFLVGLPVPAVFLYTERSSQKFLVIDGQQRLKSVFYYYEGFFGEEKKGKRDVFKLKGLNEKSRFKDKSFEDLDEADKRKLKNSVLRAFIVQQLDPNDDTSIYHIFERLNTGGSLLSNQEIRNCVNDGDFNDLLHKLNDNGDWRSILGKKDCDSRQRDIELILRFFALRNLEGYDKPMKDFLSKYMRRNRNPSPDQINNFAATFKDVCAAVVAHLGKKPFHIHAGLNAAAFDSVMLALSRHISEIPHNIKERYDLLKKDEKFQSAISSGTTEKSNVTERLRKAEEILFKG